MFNKHSLSNTGMCTTHCVLVHTLCTSTHHSYGLVRRTKCFMNHFYNLMEYYIVFISSLKCPRATGIENDRKVIRLPYKHFCCCILNFAFLLIYINWNLYLIL